MNGRPLIGSSYLGVGVRIRMDGVSAIFEDITVHPVFFKLGAAILAMNAVQRILR